VTAYREDALAAIRGLGSEAARRAFATLAAGQASISPFGADIVKGLRHRLEERFQVQGVSCRPLPGDEDQPVHTRLLSALLAVPMQGAAT